MLQILNFFRKFWLIIAIIALYFLLAGINFLPRGFNIFKKKHLLIDETPVVVKEIREIGELVTSEFYGEVYADLNEIYDDLIASQKDSIDLNRTLYFNQYSGLRDYLMGASEFVSHEDEYKNEVEGHKTFIVEQLNRLKEIKENEKKVNEELAKNIDDRKERRKLENRLEDLTKKFQEEQMKLDEEKERYNRIEEKFQERKRKYWEHKKRRNLVYIGRGWVKAGVNLKDIKEEEIIVNEGDSSSIQILIGDPVIIDADINPWFIYTDEKKVKGYEIFIARTGGLFGVNNFTDKEVTEVKIKCKEKLRQNAIDKGLLIKAKSSTVQTLENFFRLLGFKKVDVRFKSATVVVEKEI